MKVGRGQAEIQGSDAQAQPGPLAHPWKGIHYLCEVHLGYLLVCFISEGGDGEMVFTTDETPFEGENTTEMFSSGQHISPLYIRALAAPKGFHGAAPQGGDAATWMGVFCQGVQVLVDFTEISTQA